MSDPFKVDPKQVAELAHLYDALSAILGVTEVAIKKVMKCDEAQARRFLQRFLEAELAPWPNAKD